MHAMVNLPNMLGSSVCLGVRRTVEASHDDGSRACRTCRHSHIDVLGIDHGVSSGNAADGHARNTDEARANEVDDLASALTRRQCSVDIRSDRDQAGVHEPESVARGFRVQHLSRQGDFEESIYSDL